MEKPAQTTSGWERDLDIGQPLLPLPVPHRQHVVVGVIHGTQVASSVLEEMCIHRKMTLENRIG